DAPAHARLPREDGEERSEAHGVALARDAIARSDRQLERPWHADIDPLPAGERTSGADDQRRRIVERARNRPAADGDLARAQLAARLGGAGAVGPKAEHQAVSVDRKSGV